MKKIFCGLFAIICIFCGLFYNYIKKFPVSLEKIKSIADEKGYDYYDLNDMVGSGIGKLCAVGFDNIGNVQFAVAISEDDAIGIYGVSHSKMRAKRESGDIESNIKTKHYEKYELIKSDEYMICIRVYETILYSTVPKKYQDQVNQVIKEVNY